ncbi:spermidine synthase [Thalassotalea euphylliae]|uniref:Polyamine aminopropyltransferase n=1 Tax=Thalassotalea euphylliae TaxID=1655234 RepID=A0A3E0UJX6_9GAMM|nr:fused MFS/spermidine synthase [Thalassotalea euphylliae]REL36864.1 methyltransferase domain-containing protein [Thalassotalea euphylliae]
MKTNVYLLATLLAFSFFTTSALAKVIHQERSMYRNILVEDTGNLRCLKFNVKSKKTNQSCFLKSDPNRLVFNYTKLMFSGMIVNPNPSRILIVGLGGGTMSNTLHQLLPDAEIENIEIDPAVIKVARQYFSFFENDKVTSKVVDGRIFIKRALLKKQHYDWIILDAFNGDYIPEHLMTKEFLQETKKLLSDNGVLTANTFSISDLYDYESSTYQSVFGNFYQVKSKRQENRIILTTKNELPNKAQLKTNLAALHDRLRPYDVNILKVFNSFTNKQDWPANAPILTDQFSPANLLNQ